jgi:cation:H+ antiporter
VLDPGYRLELGFLLLASLVAFMIPITGQIHIVLGVVMLGLFAFYLVRVATAEDEGEPDLIGPAATIAQLPASRRRPLVIAMFVAAAAAILVCAEPFADSLVASGEALGIDRFLLVQWLAPLSSEAPEFIVAILFAVRGKAAAALGMLISAKVNQWTLLVGSLPIAYLVGGGGPSLVLDARQVEEMLLTATQTMMGIGILLALRMRRWHALALLGLFAVQFAVPGTTGRLALSAVYAAIAIALFVLNRNAILPTISAPFRRSTTPAPDLDREPERVLV